MANRLVCIQDCGLTNPTGLKHIIECGMLHGMRGGLQEKVKAGIETRLNAGSATCAILQTSPTRERERLPIEQS